MEKHSTCISWLRNYCTVRSSRLQFIFIIGVLKNSTNFTGKHCVGVSFNKVATATLLKRDSNTDIFLRNSQNFWEYPFFKNTSGGCFCTVGTAVVENIIVRNGKKHNHNKVSLKLYRISTDHNSRRSQYSQVFFILL